MQVKLEQSSECAKQTQLRKKLADPQLDSVAAESQTTYGTYKGSNVEKEWAVQHLELPAEQMVLNKQVANILFHLFLMSLFHRQLPVERHCEREL